MKKKAFYALACVLYLTGCSTPETDEVKTAQKLYPVQFSVQLEKEVISFPSMRSMPDNPIPEPNVSKADGSDKELSELCSRIEYVVFANEAAPTLIKHRQYNKSDLDLDFGIVYDSLPEGNYTFCFLAHASGNATLTGTTLSLDTVSDAFYSKPSMDIAWAAVTNKDITLKRIVSRIEFKAIDTVPKQIKSFDMAIEGWADSFDLVAEQGIINTVEKKTSYQFEPEEVGKEGMTHSFYTFIPPNNALINICLSAIGKNDELIRERNVSNITPIANKIIRYTGRLYGRSESDNTFQLSIFDNGKWGEPIEDVLPEK